MTTCLVIGLPNAGKTCFVINFAAYMGLSKIKLYKKKAAGYTLAKTLNVTYAQNCLVSSTENFTRELQAINIKIPAGKTEKELKIVDTCGLKRGINPQKKLRKSMAHTIREMQKHNVIIHILDLQNISLHSKNTLHPMDEMIYNFCNQDKNYALLANKIDLNNNQKKYNTLVNSLKNLNHIYPISALYREGFKDVKLFFLNLF